MESADEEKFDSFLNKTIILSSKDYFKRTMNRIDKERTIVDDEEYSSVIYEKMNSTSDFDKVDTKMELKTALNCLSEIEQAVIFLLFNEELTRNETEDSLKPSGLYCRNCTHFSSPDQSPCFLLPGNLQNLLSFSSS